MYHNLINILESLLNSSELTQQYDSCIMNKFHGNSYDVDLNVFKKLYFYHIIREDSGDFETQETHYVLDLDDYSISKLNKIIFLYQRFVDIDKIVTIDNEFRNVYLECLIFLKLKEERKIKLNSLKN